MEENLQRVNFLGRAAKGLEGSIACLRSGSQSMRPSVPRWSMVQDAVADK